MSKKSVNDVTVPTEILFEEGAPKGKKNTIDRLAKKIMVKGTSINLRHQRVASNISSELQFEMLDNDSVVSKVVEGTPTDLDLPVKWKFVAEMKNDLSQENKDSKPSKENEKEIHMQVNRNGSDPIRESKWSVGSNSDM